MEQCNIIIVVVVLNLKIFFFGKHNNTPNQRTIENPKASLVVEAY